MGKKSKARGCRKNSKVRRKDAKRFSFKSEIAPPTTKQKILQLLKIRDMRPFEMADILKLSRSTVSEHLQVLKKRKLVRWKGSHKVRTYSLRK